jgi:hypothetical protein
MSKKEELLSQLEEIVKQYELAGLETEAKKVREIIDGVNDGRHDPTKISINAKLTLKKYDGENKGQEPVETIVSESEL